MIIDWNKYFDAIWCINYLPYKSRKDSMEKELDRVGITQHKNFHWNFTFDSPWYEYLFNKLQLDNKCACTKVSEIKCAFAHYECIKKSQIYRYKRILIIEDDERFLKDLNMIKQSLENIPADYDIVMFDISTPNNDSQLYYKQCKNKINDYYSKLERFNNTGCYSLTDKAINIFSQHYETCILPADNYFYRFDYDKLNVKRCFLKKNLCCQVTYYNCITNIDHHSLYAIHNVYKAIDLNYDDYMMKDDGLKYSYGDYIKE